MKQSLTISVALILISISIASLGQLLLKIGMNEVGFIGSNLLTSSAEVIKKVFLNWQVIMGLIMYVFFAALWLILKEPFNIYRVSGSAIIILGIVIIAWGY